ncbi:MAG: hypothetical protein JRJ46_09650 [Deltaproteobacteria bacterium]|nr:hypothetical protein [Deltaproteobacteria bacterium]
MKNYYIEKWRIVEMEHWDKDYIDLVVPGYIRFDKGGLGEFQFGVVYGSMDYRIENYSEFERIEFSWEGQDETDSVRGRGWAMIKDNKLQGGLFIHDSDDSWFIAEK